ncbi:hypothetical protein BOSP111201_03980 [Bordetella sputigena]
MATGDRFGIAQLSGSVAPLAEPTAFNQLLEVGPSQETPSPIDRQNQDSSLETYIAAAYWGPRKESAAACAARANRLVSSLSKISPYLAGWRAKGRTRRQALAAQPLDCSLEALSALFSAGRNHRDIDGVVMEELGFSIGVWNGGDHEGASSLSMRCGLFSTVPGLSNSVVISLPSILEPCIAEFCKDLVSVLVDAWEPDWAVVTSTTAIAARSEHGPFLDRALYVSSSIAVPEIVANALLPKKLSNGHLFLSADNAG